MTEQQPNILLTRIDNRLIHGQVCVAWTKSLGANIIVVVDDEVSTDVVQQTILSTAAGTIGVDVRFFSVAKTIEVIYKASPSQKIFFVCRTPQTVLSLLQGNVPIKDVNIGNMHFSEGKRSINKKVFVDDNDMNTFKEIEKLGVNLFIQDVPSDKKEKVSY